METTMDPSQQTLETSGIVAPPPVVIDVLGLRGVMQWAQSRVLEDVRSELASIEADVSRSERSFREIIARKDAKLRSVAALEKVASEASLNIDPVLNHLQGLITSHRYDNFSFTGSSIIAHTSQINIPFKGDLYTMGSFKVKADIRSMEVGFYGLVGTITDGDNIHPHISGHRPCWGNVQAEIPKVIAAGNYGLLFEIVHDFLASYNSQSPYRRLDQWPKVQKTFASLAREQTVAVVPFTEGTSSIEEEGEVIVTPTGRWSQLARTNPVFSDVTADPDPAPFRADTIPTDNTSSGPGSWRISARIDASLLQRGFNTQAMSRHQLQTIRARMLPVEHSTSRDREHEYNRLLRYYANWLRRTR